MKGTMRITKQTFISPALAGVIAVTIFAVNSSESAHSQEAAAVPPSLVTPDKVETRIGTLDFKDGTPSKQTVDRVYDQIDFTHA